MRVLVIALLVACGDRASTQECSHGECTDAFAAEIVCDAICIPKAADPTCRFDANGACAGRP